MGIGLYRTFWTVPGEWEIAEISFPMAAVTSPSLDLDRTIAFFMLFLVGYGYMVVIFVYFGGSRISYSIG